ncbi:hypothetical protein IWW38_005452, partial [Coemansia aciculifera]
TTVEEEEETVDDDAWESGVDASMTFVYTGEHAFPGLAPALPKREEDEGEEEEEEPARHLVRAMDEDMPSAYEHGVGVDISRGVVLAPRGLSGMQYDSRLLQRMYHGDDSSCERPLWMSGDPRDSASKTLVYKYRDLLFVLLGPPEPSLSSSSSLPPPSMPSSSSAGRQRRRGKRQQQQQGWKEEGVEKTLRFSGDEARAIEAVVLSYAASLQAATARDARDVVAQRRSEVVLAERRRIPPYVFQSNQRHLTLTNFSGQMVALNRSYAGFHSFKDEEAEEGSSDQRGGGNNTVRRPSALLLSVVNAEIGNNRSACVCVRMQDKGWVTALAQRDDGVCFCVIDQPNATLADAVTFSQNLKNRAAAN